MERWTHRSRKTGATEADDESTMTRLQKACMVLANLKRDWIERNAISICLNLLIASLEARRSFSADENLLNRKKKNLSDLIWNDYYLQNHRQAIRYLRYKTTDWMRKHWIWNHHVLVESKIVHGLCQIKIWSLGCTTSPCIKKDWGSALSPWQIIRGKSSTIPVEG